MKYVLLLSGLLCTLPLRAQVRVDTLHVQAGVSIRGLAYTKRGELLAAGSKSFIWKNGEQPAFPHAGRDFRDIYEKADGSLLILSAGDSCALYDEHGRCIYMEKDSAFFADDIHFANAREGMVLCDPLQDRFHFLYTKDGGNTWSVKQLDGIRKGEAFFAASGSCMYYDGNDRLCWVSGGPEPAFLRLRGGRFSRQRLPVQGGSASKGAYSLARKGKMYVVAGGDYTSPQRGDSTLCYSLDGGKSWQLSAGSGGYRSSVIALTKRIWVCTGPSGTDISYNAARSWQPLLKEGFHVLLRESASSFYAAGSGGRIMHIRL